MTIRTTTALRLPLLLLALVFSFGDHLRAQEPQLVGHWKLATDAQDASGNQFHGQGHHLRFAKPDRAQGEAALAEFDGKSTYVEVAAHDDLQLGTDDFTLALWIDTDQRLDDELGDLVSKFDDATRRGCNLSIQNYAGVTSSQSNFRHLHFGIDSGQSQFEWVDHGRLGNAILVFGMAVFKGQLFAGTCVAGEQEAGRVFRFDGQSWTDCGSPDRGNSVSSLAVLDGQLYVAASKYRLRGSSLAESENPHLGGAVYRYDGPHRWTFCGQLPDVEAINGLVVYKGQLYASSMYAPAGFFRYEGGTKWTSLGTYQGKRVEALTVHNGSIFATGYDEGGVYRYDGERWHHAGLVEGASQTYGFATHRGELFVSEWPHAKVFRWQGGDQWDSAGRLGQEKETMPLMVYNGKLYGGTLPLAEVYRYDRPEWTKVGRVDFTPEVRYRRAWSMAVYRGRLFVGTLPSGHVHSIEIGRNVTYDHALPAGKVHLAAVRAADELRLYVNGRRVATSAKFKASEYDLSNSEPLRIGHGAHDHFRGRLGDVRLYRKALTDKQLAKLAAKNGV